MLDHLLSSEPEPLHEAASSFLPPENVEPKDIVRAKATTDQWLQALEIESPRSDNPAYERMVAVDAFAAATGTDTSLSLDERRERAMALKTPEAVRHITGMLSAYDWEFVEQAKQLRGYVVSRLVEESHPEGKNKAADRLKALKLLGDVTEVALFTQRTEVVTKNLSDEEIESEINKRLERLTLNPDTPLVERVNTEVDDE